MVCGAWYNYTYNVWCMVSTEMSCIDKPMAATGFV